MYLYLEIFLLIAILFSILLWCFRLRSIHKVRSLPEQKKLRLLSALTRPAGFSYMPDQDIFTSDIDAWQRSLGYCSLYDRAAVLGNMVFQCEPVYFDYRGRTWLIEFWKGQYGINTGAEIGVYHTDRMVPPEQYASVLFHAVSEAEMLPMKLELWRQTAPLFRTSAKQWWLTGFRMGLFSEPEDLSMKVSLTFPDYEMMASFLDALEEKGYCGCEVRTQGYTVMLQFDRTKAKSAEAARSRLRSFTQWKNRRFIRLYLRATRPFTETVDRLLYLYFFLPVVFRRIIRMRRTRYKKIPKEGKL